ncbi:DUF418 domain-containing protein [Gracilibacillus salitolerans]|uniref:DUF418 domain-containing protein n=1 Tax=Gracilibacillus salitolerans TaxID=2663022 RepID=A0A5Q2TP12_9BACI|nr:DUF418 domain-containing protein [Gracilibacillus salitolerans]QGH35857.1 DUF418 domain-containing protein [Gracilibacillus salitolerans]
MINSQRISLIDAIRGFSLLGILLANLLIFQYGIYGKDEITFFHLTPFDMFGYHIIHILIEGSFMPIFAFIFGYSLVLMVNKLEDRGLPIKRYLFRRFIMLMVFGILHSYFLWEGDILLAYGLIGILLLFFVKRKVKTIFIWFIIFFGLLFLGSFAGSSEDGFELYSESTINSYLNETLPIYQSGTYHEITQHRNNKDPLDLGDTEALFFLLITPVVLLPIFLFGIYAGKKEWLQHFEINKERYKQAFLYLIPIGLLLKITPYFSEMIAFSEVGGIVLAVGYIFLFAYLYVVYQKNVIVYAFEQVGKLSLTNYILQTVICTFIFYGYGIGLFARLGVWFAIFLGIAIFILQVFFSIWYMARFKQGPLERLLKIVVYLSFKSKPKMKTKDVAV